MMRAQHPTLGVNAVSRVKIAVPRQLWRTRCTASIDDALMIQLPRTDQIGYLRSRSRYTHLDVRDVALVDHAQAVFDLTVWL